MRVPRRAAASALPDPVPVLLLALALPALALAAATPEDPRWRPLALGAHGESVTVLRLDGGGLAVGDARGLLLRGPQGAARRVLRRGPLQDALRLPESAGSGWLAATAAGLYRVAPSGSVVSLALAPGEAARDVRRLARAGSLLAAATGAGLYVSLDGRRWQRAASGLPDAPARAVALRGAGSRVEGFAVIEERLWRVVWRQGSGGLRVESVQRQPLPSASEGEGPVDVVFDVGGADAVAVLPRALAVRTGDPQGWRILRPAWPPGASARRLVAARRALWLATDRGLLVADALAGPWRRGAVPVGQGDVGALAGDGDRLLVALGARVLEAADAPAPSDAVPPPPGLLPWRTAEGDPPIEHVQRAALRYQELDRARIGRLRTGLGLRGWLPVMSLRLAQDRDEDRRRQLDEAIVSGETRILLDRDRTRVRDFEAALSFSWDLGDLAFHPEQIDLSREARLVIQLRDDVLDEVTQLYFERRRVLVELASQPDRPAAEKLQLRLRAAELAAGLDAWTGGWFGRARSASPARPAKEDP